MNDCNNNNNGNDNIGGLDCETLVCEIYRYIDSFYWAGCIAHFSQIQCIRPYNAQNASDS